MTPKYRADIDGLRAIAVLAVIFFHADIPLFSGGYVGVDVFFVISGYLITTIVHGEIAQNRFSLLAFYERRVRRIVPALTLVTAATLALGSVLLVPERFIDLGQGAIATALFSSNILFFLNSGYFAAAAEANPLLHTWSLAVEEQFYIVYPPILVLAAKLHRRSHLVTLVALCLVSFVACVWMISVDISAAFYLFPFRAWELLIGGILALHVLPVPRTRIAAEFMTLFGALLIGFSAYQYTPETIFPGIAAILPTIGAALIIHGGVGRATTTSRLLRWRPIVFVGLISYSLYLWHWPVLLYAKLYSVRDLSVTMLISVFLLIFLLSVVSWQYVEKPFRRRRVLAGRGRVLLAGMFVLFAMVGIGFLILQTQGIPFGDKQAAAAILDLEDKNWKHWGACGQVPEGSKSGRALCGIGRSNETASFILWGDSHARALAAGVDLSAKHSGVSGVIATKLACPPLLKVDLENVTSCTDFNHRILEYVASTKEIHTVILAARWGFWVAGTRYKQETGPNMRLMEAGERNAGKLSNADVVSRAFRRTIDTLDKQGKRIVVVNPVPEIGFDVPSVYYMAQITGRNIEELISPTYLEYSNRVELVTREFAEYRAKGLLEIINPEQYLCDAHLCKVVASGRALYRDDDHLSTFGSQYVSGAFDKIFAGAENVSGSRR